jgi:hypothetical protein
MKPKTPARLTDRQRIEYADLLDLGVPEHAILELDAQIDRELDHPDQPDVVHVRILVKTPKKTTKGPRHA